MRAWYRAQNVEDGRWVYGWYFEMDGISYIISKINKVYEVKPETLGQFIGLLDCYDLRIYDGDIISDGSKLYRVYYDRDKASFVLFDKKYACYQLNEVYNPRYTKIFSNMYDGPHYMDA